MKPTVFCKNPERGVLHFYVSGEGDEHYLFSHRFSTSLFRYFGSPVCVDEALDFTLARENPAVLSVMEKLISYIHFIEQEYEVTLLRITERKQAKKRCGDQRAKTKRNKISDLRAEELFREALWDADCYFFEDDDCELSEIYMDEEMEALIA